MVGLKKFASMGNKDGGGCPHFMIRCRIYRGARPRFWSFACVVFLALLCTPSLPSQGLDGQQASLYALLTRGYAAISSSPAEAITIFETIVRSYPESIVPRRQLGSLYIGADRKEDALGQFSVADSLCPSDTTKLQIAYLLASLARNGEARSIFESLESSPDQVIRERSSAGAAALGWTVRESAYPSWGRVGGDPYYDSRFDNGIFRFWVMGGRYLTESKAVSAFCVGSFTRDTRSSGGAVPIIYSDSYSLVGGGVRLHPFAGGRIDIQGGMAIGLIERPEEPEMRGDLRALASYGWGLYPEPASPDRPRIRWKPFVEAMAMGGYYSRYENILGFGHAKAGIRLLEWSRAYGDLYIRTDIVADTRRDFFNNIVEGSVGLRIAPDFGIGVQILAEYHRGLYWDTGLPTLPYDRWYSSGRLIVALDQPFAL